MANPEHLAKLKEGVKAWNTWKTESPVKYLDLKRANLSDTKLTGIDFRSAFLNDANLTKVDLSLANLIGVKLINANVMEANFYYARLRYSRLNNANFTSTKFNFADLSYANLRKANLTNANLKGVNLCGADMSNVDLTNAILSRSIFTDTDLSQTKGLETCKHERPSILDHNTVLKSGKLPDAFLRGCGLPERLIEYYPSLLNEEPIQFYSCFISYSTKDEEFAERLHADLQAKGVRCWFAPHDLKTGEEIRERIDQEIRVRDKLLVIFSDNSINSEWVKDEVNTAFEEEGNRLKQGRKDKVLFPIRLDDSVLDVSAGWARKSRDRHIADFTDWKNHDSYTKAFDRLLKDLKASGE